MPVRSSNLDLCVLAILSISVTAAADDLHFKKSISVGGNTVSTSETWVKGARQRTVTASPAGNLVTLRQCDLKRTVTLSEQNQSYLVTKDSEDESVSQAAALMGGGPSTTSGGSITQTVTVSDTGERKQMSGYAARHLRTKVVVESSADACSKTNQSYEIDGWYADISKEPISCSQSLPPIKQGASCADRVIVRRKGSGKPGYPLHETITLQSDGGTPTKIEVATSDISKDTAQAELFDVPGAYHEVHSESELYVVATLPPGAASTAPQSPASYGSGLPNSQQMMAQALPAGMNGRGGNGVPAVHDAGHEWQSWRCVDDAGCTIGCRSPSASSSRSQGARKDPDRCRPCSGADGPGKHLAGGLWRACSKCNRSDDERTRHRDRCPRVQDSHADSGRGPTKRM